MTKEIIYQGKSYILENEEEWDEDQDTIPLSPKEQEAEDEIAKSDRNKEVMSKRQSGLSGLIARMYRTYINKYNTPNELKRLLRAVYEIIGKRFLDAKRIGDERLTEDWKKLIHDIPNVFVAEAVNPIDDMVKTYYYVINNPAVAMAFIMAISQKLNE